MKKIVLLLAVLSTLGISAQTKTELKAHFEAYYEQMKKDDLAESFSLFLLYGTA